MHARPIPTLDLWIQLLEMERLQPPAYSDPRVRNNPCGFSRHDVTVTHKRCRDTNLENLFRIRPAGVLEHGQYLGIGVDRKSVSTHVSKKLIGDLKIAKAILSWSFLDACAERSI
jgi:hypothetical protein